MFNQIDNFRLFFAKKIKLETLQNRLIYFEICINDE